MFSNFIVKTKLSNSFSPYPLSTLIRTNPAQVSCIQRWLLEWRVCLGIYSFFFIIVQNGPKQQTRRGSCHSSQRKETEKKSPLMLFMLPQHSKALEMSAAWWAQDTQGHSVCTDTVSAPNSSHKRDVSLTQPKSVSLGSKTNQQFANANI